jgi:uncharacterized protein (TIGR02646 family)
MRQIHKQAEPAELLQYRNSPGSTYDGGNFTPVKAAIRRDLLRDQGYLCAYCMRRITAESMKVEHWQSQTEFPELQLAWINLLGVCDGNEGQPWDQQTCDTRRGNTPLTYNPSNQVHQIESRVKYLGNGKIDSDDQAFADELDNVLNLNWQRLKSNRASIVEAVITALRKKEGTRTRGELEKFIESWQSPKNQMFQEYCAVAIYFLKKRLQRCS